MRTVPGHPTRLDRRTRIAQYVLAEIAGITVLPSACRYDLTVSHEKKFLWFRVAKVGTRTILNHFEERAVPLDAARANAVHYLPRFYADYFKFAFVRNPWDRLVSCWVDKVLVNKGRLFKFSESQSIEMQRFENFVKFVSTQNVRECDRHLRLQCEVVDLNNIDYLGHMETFDCDFRKICGKLGISCQEITPRNVFPRKTYREYFTDELRERVTEIYQRDIQIFGYKY